jgi:high-affinity Fe2+/Pb2+ permease
MSRRSRRESRTPAEDTRPAEARRRRRPPDKIPFAAQVALLVAVFAVTVGIAELAGAINLGTSFGIAQIVFAIVLVVLLLRA